MRHYSTNRTDARHKNWKFMKSRLSYSLVQKPDTSTIRTGRYIPLMHSRLVWNMSSLLLEFSGRVVFTVGHPINSIIQMLSIEYVQLILLFALDISVKLLSCRGSWSTHTWKEYRQVPLQAAINSPDWPFDLLVLVARPYCLVIGLDHFLRPPPLPQ